MDWVIVRYERGWETTVYVFDEAVAGLNENMPNGYTTNKQMARGYSTQKEAQDASVLLRQTVFFNTGIYVNLYTELRA